MTKLRKISANEPYFMEMRQKYQITYNEFEKFAQIPTNSTTSIFSNSGKSSSYARTLIKIIVLYKEVFETDIGSIDNFEDLLKIKQIEALPEFNSFNNSESHFYSATISCYIAFLAKKYSMLEEEADDLQNNAINRSACLVSASPTVNVAKPKPLKNMITSAGMTYSRDENEVLLAKQNSNWKCEIDTTHTTFINKADGNQYMEAHHLLPMFTQSLFQYSLDFKDNIVSLCPNCHMLVHHSINSEKENLLLKLFDDRKQHYPHHGIDIDKRTFLTYYGIIK